MGTQCHIVVTGPSGAELTERAQRRIEELERLWSRFLPDSEIRRIDGQTSTCATPQVEVIVSAETVALLERALIGWRATDGTWNPFLGSVVAELGYDRPFDHGLDTTRPAVERRHRTADVGMAAPLRLIDSTRISIDAGTTIDVGGIAKGFAADLVSQELMAAGAWGVVVNLGGDLRVRGLPPIGIDWTIDIGEPAAGIDCIATVRLPSGGVCTSTTARRRWSGPEGDRHHLIDPRTSLPTGEAVVLTTVVAGDAWWAEVAATALTINPELTLPATAALQLHAGGTVRRRNDFERYEDS